MSWMARLFKRGPWRQPPEDADQQPTEFEPLPEWPDLLPIEPAIPALASGPGPETVDRAGQEPAPSPATVGIRRQLLSLSLGSGARPAQYLGQGWSNPEKDFTWGEGELSTLRLGLALGHFDHILELDLKPHIEGDVLPQQRLAVFYETWEIINTAINKRCCLECFIAKERILAGKPAVITLRHPDFRPPAEVSKSNRDGRPLAIAVEGLRLFAIC